MQTQPDLNSPLPPELRAYFSTIGRRGAAAHSLSPEARQLGVAVRKLKRTFMTKGYAPDVARQKARARLHLKG